MGWCECVKGICQVSTRIAVRCEQHFGWHIKVNQAWAGSFLTSEAQRPLLQAPQQSLPFVVGCTAPSRAPTPPHPLALQTTQITRSIFQFGMLMKLSKKFTARWCCVWVLSAEQGLVVSPPHFWATRCASLLDEFDHSRYSLPLSHLSHTSPVPICIATTSQASSKVCGKRTCVRSCDQPDKGDTNRPRPRPTAFAR
jgi:hypothetical protein